MIAVPQTAVDLAKRFEDFHRVPKNDPLRRAHPYICPAGFWTVGFGHLCKPDHPPITEMEAEVYLVLRATQISTIRATLCQVEFGDLTHGQLEGANTPQ